MSTIGLVIIVLLLLIIAIAALLRLFQGNDILTELGQLRREVINFQTRVIQMGTRALILKTDYVCPKCEQPGFPSIKGDMCTSCANERPPHYANELKQE